MFPFQPTIIESVMSHTFLGEGREGRGRRGGRKEGMEGRRKGWRGEGRDGGEKEGKRRRMGGGRVSERVF